MKVEIILNLLVLLLFNVHYSHQFWNFRIRRPSVNVNTISTIHNHLRGRLNIPPTVYRNHFSLPSSNQRFPRPFGFGRTTQNTYKFKTVPLPKVKLPTFPRSNVPLATNIRYQRPYVHRRPFHHIRFPTLKRPIIPHLRLPHISNITHSWLFPLGIPPTIHSRVVRPEIIHPPIFKPPIVATYTPPVIKSKVFTISMNILRHGKPTTSQPIKPTTPKVENPNPDVVIKPISTSGSLNLTTSVNEHSDVGKTSTKHEIIDHTHSIAEKSTTTPSSIVEEVEKSTTTSTTPKLINIHADVGKITTATTTTEKHIETFSTMSSTTEKYSNKLFIGEASTITASSIDEDKDSAVRRNATIATTEKNLNTTVASNTKNDAPTTKPGLNVSTTGKFNEDLNIHEASTTLSYEYPDIVEGEIWE